MARDTSAPMALLVDDDEFPRPARGGRRTTARETLWATMLKQGGTYKIPSGCPEFLNAKVESIRTWLYQRAAKDGIHIQTVFSEDRTAVYVRILAE